MNQRIFFQLVDTLAMGGTERMSINIAAVMHEKGWESHLIVSRKSGGLVSHVPEGIHVHFLSKKSFYDLSAFWNLISLVRKHKPRLLHAHSTSIYWAVMLKMLVGNFMLIWHDHFGLSDQLDKYPRKDIVVLSKWIDRIITVNEKLENYWKNLIPFKSPFITTIGNFPHLVVTKTEKFPVFTFLNLANFRPQKDQLNLIRASEILIKESLEFKILLVGEFVEEDWKNKVVNEIREKGLEDYVTVVGPTSEIATLLSKVHAGVLCSESEGLPVALLEYGLAGLPVICTAVGDCQKVISSEDLGWLIPPKNFFRLAETMKELINDLDKGEERGKLLKQKVDQEYGRTSFLKSYASLTKIELDR